MSVSANNFKSASHKKNQLARSIAVAGIEKRQGPLRYYGIMQSIKVAAGGGGNIVTSSHHHRAFLPIIMSPSLPLRGQYVETVRRRMRAAAANHP